MRKISCRTLIPRPHTPPQMSESEAPVHRESDPADWPNKYPELVRAYGHESRVSIRQGLSVVVGESATCVPRDSVVGRLIVLNCEENKLFADSITWADTDHTHYLVSTTTVERCLHELDTGIFLPLERARAAGVDVQAHTTALQGTREEEDEQRTLREFNQRMVEGRCVKDP